MIDTRIIGNLVPSNLDEDTIREEFNQFVAEKFPKLAFDLMSFPHYTTIRSPHYNRTIVLHDKLATNFHRDNYGDDMMMVMWSNIKPTTVKFPDGTILQAKDGDVILIDNKQVLHKVPSNVTADDERWLARLGFNPYRYL